MLSNPWLILGLVIFWLVSVGTAGWAGWDYRDGKVAKEKLEAVTEAVDQHNEDALDDMEAAREVGARETQARVKTVTITQQVEKVIHDTPAPAVCRLTDDAFRLLGVSVAIANDIKGSAKPVPTGSNPASPAR